MITKSYSPLARWAGSVTRYLTIALMVVLAVSLVLLIAGMGFYKLSKMYDFQFLGSVYIWTFVVSRWIQVPIGIIASSALGFLILRTFLYRDNSVRGTLLAFGLLVVSVLAALTPTYFVWQPGYVIVMQTVAFLLSWMILPRAIERLPMVEVASPRPYEKDTPVP